MLMCIHLDSLNIQIDMSTVIDICEAESLEADLTELNNFSQRANCITHTVVQYSTGVLD